MNQLIICNECCFPSGYVREKHNGLVAVFCMCQVRTRKSAAEHPDLVKTDSAMSILIWNGEKVLPQWLPGSDFFNGKRWMHQPVFIWGGRPQSSEKHIPKLRRWMSEHDPRVDLVAEMKLEDILKEARPMVDRITESTGMTIQLWDLPWGPRVKDWDDDLLELLSKLKSLKDQYYNIWTGLDQKRLSILTRSSFDDLSGELKSWWLNRY